MRFAKLAAGCAAVASSAAFGVTPATALTPAVVGELCGMTMTEDPTSGPGARTAEVHGGPVVGYDAESPTSPSWVYLFCAVQVGGSGVQSDPDVALLEAESLEAAFIPPTRVAFQVLDGATTYLCAEIWIATSDGHVSIYYDEESGAWVSNPEDAHCAEQISVKIGP
jgi:hypothetical protein